MGEDRWETVEGKWEKGDGRWEREKKRLVETGDS
jgi:hypothetical protein